ncbi:hypothetical protein diail_6438 [Diaporthe ilicicola]|nr:hypothetical protein diail_6438 [Diaporthe ilicicola]
METPTRKQTRRVRPKSSESTKLEESPPIRQVTAQETDADAYQEETRMLRPPFQPSHSSPEMHDEAERRSQRPDITDRSPSEPITPVKKISGFQLDGDIAKLIKDGPARDRVKEKENGSIYLYKVKPRNTEVRLVKIGRTQKHPHERRSQIRGVCGHMEIEEHTMAIARDIPFHGFAERLIHKELSNYQHQWQCECGTRHREYFQVDEDLAIEIFSRWRDFCEQRPWDRRGKILPVWAQRLQNRARFNGTEHEFDHSEFARRWATFTRPLILEWFTSDFIRSWKRGFPHRWKIVALAELLTIVCISTKSSWITTWTVTIVLMLLIDQVVTDDMHITGRISQLMRGGLQPLLWQIPVKDRTVAGTKDLTPGFSPEKALYQRSSGSTRRKSVAANNQARVGMRQPVDDEDNADSWEFAERGEGSGRGARERPSTGVVSIQNRVSNGRVTTNPRVQESLNREEDGFDTAMTDLTGIGED